jgi:suppressor of ftsI
MATELADGDQERGRRGGRGRGRSRLTVWAAATVAALVVLAGLGTAAATALATTAPQEVGMTPGQPYADPPDANGATGRHLTITLAAHATHFDLSGRQVWGESYNGDFVAPTIHLAPGEDASITLINHLSVATNLHFHGLHVSPTEDSDNPFLCVEPGRTFTYHLTLPADHPAGTYWYHSHAMGTSCAMATMAASGFMAGDVENQIFAGLSGALVVGDDRALLPPALREITAHTVVLKDVQIDATGHIVQNTATTSINSNNPTVRLVNGLLRPTMTIRPGETQLWRLVNAGADIFYQLQLDGYTFSVVGEDGRPVAQVRTAGTLLLPPGKRYDVLVTAGSRQTVTWLRTTAYSNGPQGDAYPDVRLASVHITGDPATPTGGASGAIPGAPADLAGAPIAQHRTVVLSENATGTSFYVNGRQFSMNQSVFDTPATVNTVEEWTIVNTSGEDHPFHLHTNAFQVMSINGVALPYTNVQDIVPIPHAVGGVPGKVVIRVSFANYTGRWMFHCHIAAHEDNGMMSFINVVSH